MVPRISGWHGFPPPPSPPLFFPFYFLPAGGRTGRNRSCGVDKIVFPDNKNRLSCTGTVIDIREQTAERKKNYRRRHCRPYLAENYGLIPGQSVSQSVSPLLSYANPYLLTYLPTYLPTYLAVQVTGSYIFQTAYPRPPSSANPNILTQHLRYYIPHFISHIGVLSFSASVPPVNMPLVQLHLWVSTR